MRNADITLTNIFSKLPIIPHFQWGLHLSLVNLKNNYREGSWARGGGSRGQATEEEAEEEAEEKEEEEGREEERKLNQGKHDTIALLD
jgi:hypothetical protein